MPPDRSNGDPRPRTAWTWGASRWCCCAWSSPALLGAFLGYRLWRRLLPNTLPPAREIAQAQTLIAIAGALMVVVIGQSTARAFGLVGLGGFIRFRSGIKDTRDAAVMFVMIGVGMACGLGAVPMAVVATLFASVVLAMFDLGRRARLQLTRHLDPRDRAARRLGAHPAGVPGRARARAAGRGVEASGQAGDGNGAGGRHGRGRDHAAAGREAGAGHQQRLDRENGKGGMT